MSIAICLLTLYLAMIKAHKSSLPNYLLCIHNEVLK